MNLEMDLNIIFKTEIAKRNSNIQNYKIFAKRNFFYYPTNLRPSYSFVLLPAVPYVRHRLCLKEPYFHGSAN